MSFPDDETRYERDFKRIRETLGKNSDPKTDAILSALEVVAVELHDLNVAGAFMEGIDVKLKLISELLGQESTSD